MINILGVHLTILIGKTVPTPAPAQLSVALKDVEINQRDDGPSGFQLHYRVGRSGPFDLKDYGLLSNPLLKMDNRVIIVVRFAVLPEVLMDGIITNIQLAPHEQPGEDILTITGEDLSVLMDRDEQSRAYPAMPDYAAVQQILGNYLQFGITPSLPPPNQEALTPTLPLEQIRQQPANMTDRAYLTSLAEMYGFVFYLSPGPAPGFSQAHWGPPNRLSIPQSGLSIKMGPVTNVDSINFEFNGLSAQKTRYTEQGEAGTISSPSPDRRIPLVRNVAEALRSTNLTGYSCRAAAQAQGAVDKSFDDAVTATGELNTVRYNKILKPRALVGVRGAGDTFDGMYYVKSVTHNIDVGEGQYKQSFTLKREGTGTISPFIVP
ncbi:phage late control D family protein [Methylomonas sp. MgM2]